MTELSMRRTATSGECGVVRRRRNGSRSVMGKVSFSIDVGKRFGWRPQVYFLIGGVKADGRFRLRRILQA